MVIGQDERRQAQRNVRVRPLQPEDLPASAALSGAAFGVELHGQADRARWLERVSHPYHTDPDGCFVAEDARGVIGVAAVIVRDGMWILSLLAVDPETQSAGAGRALLARALRVGDPRALGLIVSADDSRALRLYALAGFTLLPTFQAQGFSGAKPAPGRCRAGAR